ncbi:Membrane proteinase PrsW, cleaves anti-sigma factor RsiW, M82 family [Actinopolymorpha cephalotaxi]|uniref:Membrane proteinase PrsW, cleaves anti-sigma factor RsiW, M82 family n=1 Tax=Actinopolymorpha cephalotaxi TaxID=504797 RepID=A0A1I3B086_9ACTN|nr:PrsW family glutamic-type intramembrane protease [Actinopolymorpha cephalotaxi]NYH84266.1 RsiW-degrading membrane proteinase PrsW (M82 family) [Actinopolymorpha cephalotaxi]SFH55632.1 Membrane proteinase PrsW, cleaves anti-sigma factor RsiW, M82 family [Actinopolymorpha cephalotaxi]
MVSTSVRTRSRPRRLYLRIFFTGLLLWLIAVMVTLLTSNANLVPTVVLLGSFLVPVSFVAWAFERWRDEDVTTELVVTAFVLGGLLGVFGASLLESYVLHPSPLLFLGVGLIEEGAKLAALVFVTRHMTRRHTRDGVVLGAAVGFGFAAFESAGYAFNAMITEKGLSLPDLVQTELLRGVLAPVGHGLWTAILGGVLFHVARTGHVRYLRGALPFTYLWVAILHALWDSMHSIALALTLVLTGVSASSFMQTGYLPQPTADQLRLFTILSIGGLGFVSVLGLATLAATWRSGRGERRQPSPRATRT